MERVARTEILQAVALAGRGTKDHQAHFNSKEGGYVFFPATEVRLFLRDDMLPVESAIVDAGAVEILLTRIQSELSAVELDYSEGENGWTFRAFSRPDGYLVEIARGEGISKAEAVAYAYAEAFTPLKPTTLPVGA